MAIEKKIIFDNVDNVALQIDTLISEFEKKEHPDTSKNTNEFHSICEKIKILKNEVGPEHDDIFNEIRVKLHKYYQTIVKFIINDNKLE